MPPKGKKGKKGKKMPVLIDGVDTSSMTRDQLEAFALRLKAEMDREREERNYFQLERDKIRTFWDITRTQLEEVKYELQQKEKEIETAQELADVDMKYLQQRMKHLAFENNNHLGEQRIEAMTQLKLAQDHHRMQERELLRDKRSMRRILRERMEIAEMQMRQMEAYFNEKMLDQRLFFEHERKDNEMLHEERMLEQKKQLELFYGIQMFEEEERKNQQIKNLQQHHDQAFTDMKNYYNDITLNNLALIGSMKEQLEYLRRQAERSDRIAHEMTIENRKLKEPLERAKTQLADLKRKLEFYERDKIQMARLKVRNEKLDKRIKELTWEAEALILRNEGLAKERKELKLRFNELIVEIQQRAGLKNVLLERKLTALMHEDEKRAIIVEETLEKCPPNLKPQMGPIDHHIRTVVDKKNKIINDLRFQLAKLSKKNAEMYELYEGKLKAHGIPVAELGFECFVDREDPVRYLCGPAGVLTDNA
ncbi:dynein regulatory complex subunit 4 [Scaptodrosophila lebanonensis]|uniref:Dynein regulatory complex subunit 4 n=1 Tax=Drosophila lebanonensis TaxID=7225 RepID=A0A6J2TYS3_DROLE|nr:dynein regulatory complex subunit 4 [Scaptodrosophila lebanonensis]